MEIRLRRLAAGEILDHTFQLYRAHFRLLFGMAALAILIQAPGLALLSRFSTQKASAWQGGAESLAELFVSLLAYALPFAAVTSAITELLRGRPAHLVAAYRRVWRQWFRYIRLSLAAGLLTAWPFLLVIALFFAQQWLIAHTREAHPGFAAGSRMILLLLEYLVALPLCIWLSCRYALSMTASVIEDLSVVAAIRRSVRLSQGVRLKIFLLFLLAYVGELVLGFAASVPAAGATMLSAGDLPATVVIYRWISSAVISALLVPTYGIGLAVIYLDARAAKEHDAAGMPPQQTERQAQHQNRQSGDPTADSALQLAK